jgi:hypothetical protein
MRVREGCVSQLEERLARGAECDDLTCLGPGLGPSGGSESVLQARKLRQVNDRVGGYEPGGRRFESCWARQLP